MRNSIPALLVLCLSSWPAWGGIYYSAEKFADPPAQRRGFLLDLHTLRTIASPPGPGSPASGIRERYQAQAARLEQKKSLNADDLADLGALWIRLGRLDKALAVLREAQRKHPQHFRVAANLGTAWQLQGDLSQAASCLEQAVILAPPSCKEIEELHLKLVRRRSSQGRGKATFDDLFGIRFVSDKGEYEAGKLAAEQKKKLTPHVIGLAQQLALSLPEDGPLLWQLAELANAHGDVKIAAAMMDGCITTYGMTDADLRQHRRIVRAAADRLPKLPASDKNISAEFRSKRLLLDRLDPATLPAISTTGTNALPWELLGETVLNKKFQPAFPRYLQDLAGKQVAVRGFLIPLEDTLEASRFMLIENPIGCWCCEMPETPRIICIELPAGKTLAAGRNLVRVTGKLSLNASDPEDFLYAVRGATVAGVE